MTRTSLCNPSPRAFDNHNYSSYRDPRDGDVHITRNKRFHVPIIADLFPHSEDECGKPEENGLPTILVFARWIARVLVAHLALGCCWEDDKLQIETVSSQALRASLYMEFSG